MAHSIDTVITHFERAARLIERKPRISLIVQTCIGLARKHFQSEQGFSAIHSVFCQTYSKLREVNNLYDAKYIEILYDALLGGKYPQHSSLRDFFMELLKATLLPIEAYSKMQQLIQEYHGEVPELQRVVHIISHIYWRSFFQPSQYNTLPENSLLDKAFIETLAQLWPHQKISLETPVSSPNERSLAIIDCETIPAIDLNELYKHLLTLLSERYTAGEISIQQILAFTQQTLHLSPEVSRPYLESSFSRRMAILCQQIALDPAVTEEICSGCAYSFDEKAKCSALRPTTEETPQKAEVLARILAEWVGCHQLHYMELGIPGDPARLLSLFIFLMNKISHLPLQEQKEHIYLEIFREQALLPSLQNLKQKNESPYSLLDFLAQSSDDSTVTPDDALLRNLVDLLRHVEEKLQGFFLFERGSPVAAQAISTPVASPENRSLPRVCASLQQLLPEEPPIETMTPLEVYTRVYKTLQHSTGLDPHRVFKIKIFFIFYVALSSKERLPSSLDSAMCIATSPDLEENLPDWAKDLLTRFFARVVVYPLLQKTASPLQVLSEHNDPSLYPLQGILVKRLCTSTGPGPVFNLRDYLRYLRALFCIAENREDWE